RSRTRPRVVSFLGDTNVVSEVRKGERGNPAVRRWLASIDDDALFLSVLVVGEIRKGVERLRRRDTATAEVLDTWLSQITDAYAERLLPVTTQIAERWGRMNVPDPLPVVDSLLAATAHVHGLTVATRNVSDYVRTGVPTYNPFDTG
ncbi:MAG TPA: type II toxin-antitoxin system VapC family toxin, partial [Euzebyales bacterium]|nr:type II toxin-antitoxin system VapC family toxin [Euzebyales bacterium]